MGVYEKRKLKQTFDINRRRKQKRLVHLAGDGYKRTACGLSFHGLRYTLERKAGVVTCDRCLRGRPS